ncbi:MAG TPA: methicillin resistance protein [Clostridiales bacterium]|nr:methicillin resistance protein [Clostridiales bacterium]
MAQEFVSCHPADRDSYTAYLARTPGGDVLQTHAWGELKSRTGWVPRHYGVRDGSDWTAVVSILKRPLPGPGGLALGYAPRGPVVDGPQALGCLVNGLREIAVSERLAFLKVDPGVEDTRFASLLLEAGFRPAGRGQGFEGVQPRHVMRLSLERPLDAILAGFSPKTRYNVNLAVRRGVTTRPATTPEPLPVFYRLLQATARRDGFGIRSYRYYQDLWDCLVEKGLARLFLAEYRGEVLAGTILFHLGTTAWYVYGASSNSHRQVMPNHALQWAMIRWAAEQGCTVYDFRGVSGDLDPAGPLYGLYRFKRGFGATLAEYVGEYDLPFRPFLYWTYTRAEPAYRALRARIAGGNRRRGET